MIQDRTEILMPHLGFVYQQDEDLQSMYWLCFVWPLKLLLSIYSVFGILVGIKMKHRAPFQESISIKIENSIIHSFTLYLSLCLLWRDTSFLPSSWYTYSACLSFCIKLQRQNVQQKGDRNTHSERRIMVERNEKCLSVELGFTTYLLVKWCCSHVENLCEFAVWYQSLISDYCQWRDQTLSTSCQVKQRHQ